MSTNKQRPIFGLAKITDHQLLIYAKHKIVRLENINEQLRQENEMLKSQVGEDRIDLVAEIEKLKKKNEAQRKHIQGLTAKISLMTEK